MRAPGHLTSGVAVVRTRLVSTTVALVMAALVAAMLLVAGTGSAQALSAPDQLAVARTTNLDTLRAMDPEVYERRVQRLINKKREARGLRAVRLHSCTDVIAEDWGSYLAENLEFYHQDLGKFFNRCDATYAGETLARGAITPRHMVRLWMESDGHRRVLLSKYPNRIGLGAYQDSRGDWLVAADFTRI